MNIIDDLFDFIKKSPTSFQGGKNLEERLKKEGYQFLSLEKPFLLELGGKYAIATGTAVMAFELGEKPPWEGGFHITGSHLDSPGFRLKPKAKMVSEGVFTLNTEVYGGPIYHTWFDRPLSLAGRVLYRKQGKILEEIPDFKKPLAIIPSLAIHMNRGVNEGQKWNPGKDLIPVFSLDADGELSDLLFQGEEVLDYDLFLYPVTEPTVFGPRGEFMASPRLDNLAMVHSSLRALLESSPAPFTKVFFAYDHEEIGSHTAQGASSPLGREILERIVMALGGTKEDYFRSLHQSFFFSCDMAHGVHPNAPEVADPTNRPALGGGPVLKIAANRSYITDGKAGAIFHRLCDLGNLPRSTFVNASNRRGGSTIGPLTLAHLPIPGGDIGNPLWAMHSAVETGSPEDHRNMTKFLTLFYETPLWKL